MNKLNGNKCRVTAQRTDVKSSYDKNYITKYVCAPESTYNWTKSHQALYYFPFITQSFVPERKNFCLLVFFPWKVKKQQQQTNKNVAPYFQVEMIILYASQYSFYLVAKHIDHGLSAVSNSLSQMIEIKLNGCAYRTEVYSLTFVTTNKSNKSSSSLTHNDLEALQYLKNYFINGNFCATRIDIVEMCNEIFFQVLFFIHECMIASLYSLWCAFEKE